MLTIILIVSFISIICCDCDEEKLTTKHYYELGCTPVQNLNGNGVSRFDCPDFEALDTEKCHYNGKIYNQRDFIEKEHLAPCESGCFCGGKYLDTTSQFVCNLEFCQEQVTDFIGPCVYQRSLNNCCADNIICDSKLIQSLHQCHVNDVIYHEGEFMYQTERCHTYKCLCSKEFNNSTEPSKNSKCQLIIERCDIQLRQLYRYQSGCAPVYFGNFPNCPSDYRCPKENDKVISGDRTSTEDTCKFGKLSMKKGDRLDDNCYNCTCIMPPMLFCRQYADC